MSGDQTTAVITTEQFTANAVKSYDVTEARLAELKKLAEETPVPKPGDKEGEMRLKEAFSIVRNVRLAVENKRKELKAVALEYGRAVDGEAKRLTGVLEPLETKLNGKRVQYDNAVLEAKKARAVEVRNRLTAAGFSFDGFMWVLGVLTLSPDAMEALSDEALADWEARAEKERARIADEAKRKAEAEAALKAESERLEQQRKDLEERERRLRERELEPAPGDKPVFGQMDVQPRGPAVASAGPEVITETAGEPIVTASAGPEPKPYEPENLKTASVVTEDKIFPPTGPTRPVQVNKNGDYLAGFAAAKVRIIEKMKTEPPCKREDFIKKIELIQP